MKLVQENIVPGQGYNLHLLQSKKYKTVNLVVKMKAPLERETITKRALLPYVLQQGTQVHPDERSLRIALDELYGAVLNISASKKGESHILTIRLEVANEAYLSAGANVLEQAMALLSEIMFEPKVENQAFDSKIVSREKQTLKQKVESIVDDKMSYANMRLIDEMCKDEAYQLHVHGYLEDLDEITPENLFDYYQRTLKENEMDVYVLGDFEETYMQDLVQKNFKREKAVDQEVKPASNAKSINEVQQIEEEQNVQQGKLHLGYRTNITYNDPDYFALQVFNGLFGGFPSSKLFMNVREKHSLAYYAASRFESHKGLLFVFSGVDPSDYNQAKEIIHEQMKAMKNGDFTEEQVEETKELVVNQLLETMDHPQGLIEILYHQVLANSRISTEQILENVKKVTKEDLIQVGKKMELDTIYFLTSKGGSNDE